MTATSDTTSTLKWRRTASGVLIGWMVFSFAIGALTKFYWGDTFFGPAYSEKFVGWGYPSWFRFIVGAGELIAAGMLLNRRWRFLGAGILFTITAGGTLTHVINHDPFSHAVSAPVHMVLAAIVAYGANPRLVKQLVTPQDT